MFEGGTDAATQAIHDTLVSVFDTARDEIEAAMRSAVADPSDDDPEHGRVLVARSLARLSPARAAEYRRRLNELSDEFGDDQDAPDTKSWGVVLAVYPMPPNPKEPSDD
jgi:hypothetical protein